MMSQAQLQTEGPLLSRLRLRKSPAMDRVLDLVARQFLAPYLGREQSVAGAARELGVSVSRMSYQTKRLLEVGLIAETRQMARAGRPIHLYRSTADEYVVALADVDRQSVEQFLLDGEEPLRRALVRQVVLALGRSKGRGAFGSPSSCHVGRTASPTSR